MISTQVMLLFVRLLPSLFPLSKNMNISFIRGKCVLREWATGVCPAMDWSLIHLIVRFVLSHYTSGASPFICSLRSSLYYHESYSDTEKVQGSVITRLCTKASRNFNALPPGLWGQPGSLTGKGINSTGPNRFYTTSTRTVWRLKLLWTLMKTAWVKQSIPS